MASVVTDNIVDFELPMVPLDLAKRRRVRWGRGLILWLAAAYFIIPIYAALKFSLQNINGKFSLSPITAIPSQPGLGAAFFLSMRLAFVTLAIVLFLMVPTMIYVHMKMPRFRRFMEVVTILPIVIPPIVLILGVLEAAPLWLKSSPYLLSLVYVVLAMPFVYRSLDSGLGALDVKTLVEAARSLGSGWISTIWRVLVPNLRSALLSATVLTLALVLGEFTMASLDLWETLPVWIVDFDQTNAHISTAVAMISLLATWALLTLIVSVDRSHSRKRRRNVVS
jgi:putative spermidine/putrescine transport system permease protein